MTFDACIIFIKKLHLESLIEKIDELFIYLTITGYTEARDTDSSFNRTIQILSSIDARPDNRIQHI
jgi:hypothetical protein